MANSLIIGKGDTVQLQRQQTGCYAMISMYTDYIVSEIEGDKMALITLDGTPTAAGTDKIVYHISDFMKVKPAKPVVPAYHSPIVETVTTTKSIAPGRYGQIEVSLVSDRLFIGLVGHGDVTFTVNELRDTARLFTEIADYLEQK